MCPGTQLLAAAVSGDRFEPDRATAFTDPLQRRRKEERQAEPYSSSFLTSDTTEEAAESGHNAEKQSPLCGCIRVRLGNLRSPFAVPTVSGWERQELHMKAQ